MAKRFAYLTMAVIVLIYLERKLNMPYCTFIMERENATISTVTKGVFSETIPQTGKVLDGKLVVEIDQMYQRRIKKGLTATSTFNNVDLNFKISAVDTTIRNGRFSVQMDFADSVIALSHGQSVRLRIMLGKTREATLIPVGGFYKDTGGAWIYVMTDESHFVKRNIKLGSKNPQHLEVLQGLQPGEKVITSSYENFANKDKLSLWEIERSKPLELM
jgi:HlyD family secretion protein